MHVRMIELDYTVRKSGNRCITETTSYDPLTKELSTETLEIGSIVSKTTIAVIHFPSFCFINLSFITKNTFVSTCLIW